MLVLKFFAAVGTVLTASILVLNAYLEPARSDAAARIARGPTAASLFTVTPKPQPRLSIDPHVVQPIIAVASASTRPTRHRQRAR